ncbi:MAG TPA: pyridoxal phosphate-dependent aminotransferase [Methanomicrobiales archaeon]|nr:pyridoxal phosphate-dependent aminotransferase [Methanomicrobiales archaeon]
MRDSERCASRIRGVELSGIRKMFDAAGPDAINMGLGQPDFDTPQHIKEAAIRAIEEGKTAAYTMNAGIPELRTAIAEKMQRENGLEYSPSEILVTAGGSEALHLIIEALVDEGDRVLFADPGFVSYSALTAIAGGRGVGLPLDANLHIEVERAMELMDGARMLILNSPANPTGAVESEKSIRALVEYAADAGVTVVSDEVYEHFIYGKKHFSAARYGEDVITINAASKTYAMVGWRLGFLAAPQHYIDHCLKIHQYCQACATAVSQYAALAAYTGDQAPVREMQREYQARRDILHQGLKNLGISFPLPEGAFYAFVPLGTDLMQRITAKGVIITPGSAFGKNMPEHARLSYATSRENIKRAIERIGSAME